jgi:NAD(P)-dependent dehydrogenase (short-subunit alcohol dehydrogenase family)
MEARRLEGFALVLGASSGFGEATAVALARAGLDVIGVHLDRPAAHVQAVQDAIRAAGREAWFFNVNAADDDKRRATLDEVAARLAARAKGEKVRVLLHSLAFGTLKPLLAPDGDPAHELSRANVEMTLDVMASSLAYWAQDLLRRGLFARHARVFAMTSAGSRAGMADYGAVSAAKAALEAYVRQLAIEGAPHGITANAILAGVTDTPALRRIPQHERLIATAQARNPSGRLTRPEDVAAAIVALAAEETYWLTGNVIQVDGGENVTG